MSRHIFYLSLVSLAVVGCSSNSSKQAVGSFDYVDDHEAKQIVVPKDLDKPDYQNKYAIPNNINKNGPVGPAVDVRAPSLVLPIATASRIEQKSNEAKVWFDQAIEDKDLQLFIYQSIKDELALDQASLVTIDAKNKIFESSWLQKVVESETLFISSIEQTEEYKFRFNIETKPHGRSVAVSVSLIDYKFSNSDGSRTDIDPIDKHRAEVAMLNRVISQVDYKYRLASRENRLLRANQKLVTLGENKDGQAAYIVEMPIDDLWANLPIFFENYGFTVDDLNETKKVYYVNYKQPDNGWWDTLWGDGAPVLLLADGKYQFKLVEDEQKTILTLHDEQGNVLSRKVLEDNFPQLEPALSFRDGL